MRNFPCVFVSVVLVLHLPHQTLSTPYFYTSGTNVWSNDGSLPQVQTHDDIVTTGPARFFAKISSNVKINNTTNNNHSVCKESNGQFADPKYCDKYYDCWEGRPVSSGQCSHGLMFNEQTSSCDYPANVNCDGKEVNQPLDNVDHGCEEPYGKFANPNDCRKYTVCHAGIATYYTCEEGLAYDKVNGICAPPVDSSCLQGPPNDIPPGEDFPEIPLDPDTIKPVNPPGPDNNDGGMFPIGPDWPKGTTCPTSLSGFFPITGDCKSVLVCIRGKGYLLSCPSGNYYHPSLASCKPGAVDNCEQMRFYVANVKTSEPGIQYAYVNSQYPLLPVQY